ncbi:MAG: hypothetical protein AB1744_03470, partial [Candidatus Zixiibacteriota bacterium]
MFDLHEFTVNLLTSLPELVLPALLVLAALTILLYRRTTPPLSGYWRTGLSVFRFLALLALFAALSEPIIGYTRQFERSRKVALLLDHSASMDKIEADKSRQARVDSLLSTASFADLTREVKVTPYYLGGNLT